MDENDEWVYTKLKGIPSTMRWPVQVLEHTPDGVEVLCKTDNAM